MARTELPNGVILPAEYSDDWYEDMTSNLTKLDDVIGSDSEKLNSNDVAFLRMSSAALTDGGTGNFSDLNSSNKLKTGDYVLDSGRKLYQVVSVDSTNETFTVGNSLFKITAESDLAPVAESGDYDDLDNKPDLNPYDQHIVNTDIHVTAADKNKWNNGVTQSYVFRYSSTALVASSTNSNTLLDNTDNLKVGDKVIDSSGVLFSITAIDTVNSTFTVGSALIDLALDANVVHTNRNDDVSIPLNSTSAELGVTGGYTDVTFLDKNNKKLSGLTLGNYASSKLSYVRLSIFDKDVNNNEIQDILEYSYVASNANAYLRVYRDNFCTLGSSLYRWKGVYATNYYYGANNVEFSTKFVTSDTAQTITEIKTFTNTIKSQKEIEFTGSRLAYILPEFSAGYSGLSLCTYGANGAVKIGSWKVDDNDNTKHVLDTSLGYLNVTTGSVNSVNSVYLNPRNTTVSKLGDSTNKWKEINGLTPSSLGLPANRADSIDISGYFTQTGSGDTNTYDVLANGYIYLQLANVVTVHCFTFEGSSSEATYIQTFSRGNDGQLYVLFPVRKNDTFRSTWYTGSTVTVNKAMFIPCQGNI